jgi:hypothetical protein
MTTNRQLVANQRNARSSSGPLDSSGTRFNAVNHGIMSSEVLIRSGDNREDASELDCLSAGLRDQLSPDGALEDLFFDQIVAFAWRWRRAIRYESARITTRTAQAVARHLRDESHRDEREFYGVSLEGSGRDIDHELADAQSALVDLDAAGDPVQSPSLRRRAVAIAADRFGARLNRILGTRGARRGRAGLMPDEAEAVIADVCARCQLTPGQFWSAVRSDVEAEHDGVQREVADRDQRRRNVVSAAALPEDGDLRKVQRYEAHLSRQLHRALRELQHLQAQRLRAPATAA